MENEKKIVSSQKSEYNIVYAFGACFMTSIMSYFVVGLFLFLLPPPKTDPMYTFYFDTITCSKIVDCVYDLNVPFWLVFI